VSALSQVEGPSVAGEFLVLGQKFSVAKTKSVLVRRRRINLRNLWLFLCLRVFVANFVFCPLLIYSQSQEVQKSVQNMLKTRSFLAKRCKKTFIFDKKAPKNAHFYPRNHLFSPLP